jgi:hypothetical protein
LKNMSVTALEEPSRALAGNSKDRVLGLPGVYTDARNGPWDWVLDHLANRNGSWEFQGQLNIWPVSQ